MQTGKIESLWRYPVKSLMGEGVDQLDLDRRGVAGDRVYAIANTEGKLGSGKNTRRFRRIDGLCSLFAEKTENGVAILFPDGSQLTHQNPLMNNKLSQTLGQTVTLSKETDVSHFDDGAVHILSTAALNLLHKHQPDLDLHPQRFRANVLLDTHYLDHELVGKVISVGGLVLEVTHKTQRCRMVAIAQPERAEQAALLKAIAQHFDLFFGVYARVLSVGSLSIGDHVELSQAL